VWEKIMIRLLPIVLILLSTVLAQQTSTTPPPNPCEAPEQKQLNFWVGEWDATWPGPKEGEIQKGTNSIRRVLEGCIVEENFSGGADMHLRGKSVSVFDTRAGKWKQTWVDNEGGYLDFVGEFKDGQMILGREFQKADGTKVMQRMVFKNIKPDEFDWSWEASKDGGETWQVQWPIHYKRRS
jgi:hypothetical protein